MYVRRLSCALYVPGPPIYICIGVIPLRRFCGWWPSQRLWLTFGGTWEICASVTLWGHLCFLFRQCAYVESNRPAAMTVLDGGTVIFRGQARRPALVTRSNCAARLSGLTRETCWMGTTASMLALPYIHPSHPHTHPHSHPQSQILFPFARLDSGVHSANLTPGFNWMAAAYPVVRSSPKHSPWLVDCSGGGQNVALVAVAC